MRIVPTLLGLGALLLPALATAQVAEFTFPADGDEHQGAGGARMFDNGDGVAGDRTLEALEECDVVAGVLVVDTAQFLANANCRANFELRIGGRIAGDIEVLPDDDEVAFTFPLEGGVGGPDFSLSLILQERLAVGCGFVQFPMNVSAWTCEDVFAEGENRRPACDIGGPYQCDEGGLLTLTTDASDVDDGPDPLEIGFDFDGDDDYGDAEGDDPVVDCGLFDGPDERVLRMRVWDGDKERICESALSVANLAPDVEEPWRPPLQGAQEQLFRYCLNAEDPSPLDPVTYELTRSPNGVVLVQEDPAGATGCVEWTPQVADLDANPHEFCVAIRDDDDGLSNRCWPVNVVENPNSPAAFAGEDQEVEPCAVRLCCQGTDPRGLPLNYTWSQVDGPAEIFFEDPHAECADVAINAVGDYTFQCAVENGELTSPPDEVRVTVQNQPATCDAGFDFRCFTEERCILDGRRSADPNNDPMFFRWVQISPEEPRVTIPGFTNKIAGFFAQQAGVYCFQLECRDHEVDSEPDEVCVAVNQRAKPAQREEDEDVFQDMVPVAHCGRTPQVVDVDDIVHLDGSRSYDPDGNPINVFQWTYVSGPVAEQVLENPDEKKAAFTPTEEGVYVFSLRVQDSPPADIPDGDARWSVACHTVVQAAADDNHPPIASTGDGVAAVKGSFATLDGSHSRDPDGDSLTYQWEQLRGPSVTLLDEDTANPTFAACTTGIYQFSLVVNDGRVDSPPAEIWATVHSPCNEPPVADAGEVEEARCVAPGNIDPLARVLLDGRQSHDPDPIAGATSLKYQWLQTGGLPTDVELAFTQVAYLEPLLWDQYQYRLFALDSWDLIDEEPEACWEPAWSLPDDVYRIVHCNQNHIPIAEAGDDSEWLVGDTVVLNGCDSIDGDGDELIYTWRQIAGPPVEPANMSTCQPSFAADSSASWCFELRVDDEWIESLPDTVCHDAIPNNNEPPVARCPSGTLVFRPGQQVPLDGAGSFDPNGDTLTFRWTECDGVSVTISAADQPLASFRAPQLGPEEEARELCFRLSVNDGRASDVSCDVTLSIAKPPKQNCDDLCPETVEDKCLCPVECRPNDLSLNCDPTAPPPPIVCEEGQSISCRCEVAGCQGVAQCDTTGSFNKWEPECDCSACDAGAAGGGPSTSSKDSGCSLAVGAAQTTGPGGLAWMVGLMLGLAWRR